MLESQAFDAVCGLDVVGGVVEDWLGRKLGGPGWKGASLHVFRFEGGDRKPVVIAVGGNELKHRFMGLAVLSFMRGSDAGQDVEVISKSHLWGSQWRIIGVVASDVMCERQKGEDEKNGTFDATLGTTAGDGDRGSEAVLFFCAASRKWAAR